MPSQNNASPVGSCYELLLFKISSHRLDTASDSSKSCKNIQVMTALLFIYNSSARDCSCSLYTSNSLELPLCRKFAGYKARSDTLARDFDISNDNEDSSVLWFQGDGQSRAEGQRRSQWLFSVRRAALDALNGRKKQTKCQRTAIIPCHQPAILLQGPSLSRAQTCIEETCGELTATRSVERAWQCRCWWCCLGHALSCASVKV